MKFFEIMFVFIFCCVAGWINEVVFRSIKNKKLINPGFMHGCSLPIYGCGGVVMYFFSNYAFSHMMNIQLKMILMFTVAIIFMTLLELFTGLFFIKVYHIKLWDYSNEWGNYKGVICPLFSLIWGAFCVVFYYLINPWLSKLAIFASHNVLFIFFMGMYVGLFLCDMVDSLNLLSKVKEYAKHIKENIQLIGLKKQVHEFFQKHKKIKSFSSVFKINGLIKKYISEKNKSDISNQSEDDK